MRRNDLYTNLYKLTTLTVSFLGMVGREKSTGCGRLGVRGRAWKHLDGNLVNTYFSTT